MAVGLELLLLGHRNQGNYKSPLSAAMLLVRIGALPSYPVVHCVRQCNLPGGPGDCTVGGVSIRAESRIEMLRINSAGMTPRRSFLYRIHNSLYHREFLIGPLVVDPSIE